MLVGPGSVFTKALRDSRRALLLAVAFLAFVLITGAAAIASAFGTAATRQEMMNLAATLPAVFQGLLGRPARLDTLGGLIEWRYTAIVALLMPIWSILALSGTLASEASRGSLDLLATTGISRRRLALEKLGAHLVVLAVAMAATATLTWFCGIALATLPGDEISVRAAAGYGVLAFVIILAPGALAFALGPFVGRGAAAGLAGLVMVVAYFVNGFRSSIGLFETLSPLSWYAWTGNHIPLAGEEDWPGVVFLGAVIVGLLVVGVIAFERRDVGSTIRLRWPSLPGWLIGLRGPFGRSFGERIGAAVAWGAGIGAYVLLISTTLKELVASIHQVPAVDQVMRLLYPDIDYATVGGMLQLVFVEFGVIIFGIAAATLVAGWSSEESSGRLEVVLSAPLTRQGWLLRSGLGTFGAIVLTTAIVAGAAALGAASQGSDSLTPFIGAFVFALYGLAWAGIAIGIAGLTRSSVAAAVVVALTVGSFLITLLATALKLPDWVNDLALSTHYGRPMVGTWDAVGVIASLVLAFGGLAIGAWGLGRRDIRG